MCHKAKINDYNLDHNSLSKTQQPKSYKFPKHRHYCIYTQRAEMKYNSRRPQNSSLYYRDRLLWDILPRLLFDPSPVHCNQQRNAPPKGLYLLVCYLVVPLRKENRSVHQEKLKSMRTHLNMVYASLWAGSFTLGLSSRSWIPRTICVACYHTVIGRR